LVIFFSPHPVDAGLLVLLRRQLAFLQVYQVFPIQTICNRNEDFIPSVVPGFVAANEYQRIAFGIERI
jgi:hypothetical protein